MQAFHQTNEEARSQDPEAFSNDNSFLKSYDTKASTSQPDQSGERKYENEPQSKKLRIRLAVFGACLAFLLVGRLSIPQEVTSICIDRVQDLFLGLNKTVMENESLRNALQIICSLFMDVMFISTGINWIIKGGSSRLIVTTVSFYLLRAMVQAVWVSPYPAEGIYWWDYPGFPSLVVPYGLGTDFFFSGHIGFVTICALEWRANGKNLVAWALAIGGVYTGIILMLYRVHYSIDLFTGVTFAHYMFMIFDDHKVQVDRFFIKLFYKVSSIGSKGYYNNKKPVEIEQQLYNTMKG